MPEPATGTVTFLFTDIEGSTRLWEEQPEGMRVALERHDAILRTAIEANDDYIFKTIGDAFCAAFSAASDALNTALSAQQSLLANKASSSYIGSGDSIAPTLQVRMALYTGDAEYRDNEYRDAWHLLDGTGTASLTQDEYDGREWKAT